MESKIQDLFGHYLTTEHKVCKLCKHSYIRDESETGYCKLNENTSISMTPKIVNEMASCLRWEKK